MGQKILGAVFLAAGGLMILGAAVMMIYNHHIEVQAKEISQNTVMQLDSQTEETVFQGKNEPVNPIFDSEKNMPEKEVDGNIYIGILEIPSIKRKLPVISSWDYEKLKISPCRYAGSVYQDNLVIAAHNYKSHFKGIEELSAGTEIYFTDAESNQFVYRIESIGLILPNQNDVLVSEGEWDLTLFTCNNSGSARWVVRCIKSE